MRGKKPAKRVTHKVMPRTPTPEMLEMGKHALWEASCREFEPTDYEIQAVYLAMFMFAPEGKLK